MPPPDTATGAEVRSVGHTHLRWPPTSGAPGPASADLIDATLAAGTKSGHKFTMTGNASGYVINVVPESYGNSGSRTFYSDQTMTIRQNYGQEPATINSPEMK